MQLKGIEFNGTQVSGEGARGRAAGTDGSVNESSTCSSAEEGVLHNEGVEREREGEGAACERPANEYPQSERAAVYSTEDP